MARTCRKPAPPQDRPSPNNTDAAKSNDHNDIDKQLLGEESLWVELFNGGRFRLAVKCDTCGRWLTSSKSKAAGRGRTCAARAVHR